MKKLNRPDTPRCLDQLKLNPIRWEDVTPAQKSEIWVKLNEMQNNFCGFCEKKLEGESRHIEHLIPRRILKLTSLKLLFDWSNLYGSCETKNKHCGRYKDDVIKDYDAKDLIKPDIEYPSDYFVFTSNGDMFPKENLQLNDKRKATEMIRVMNLNSPSLIGLRAVAIQEAMFEYTAILEMKLCCQDADLLDEIELEIQELEKKYSNAAFRTSVMQNIKTPLI